MLTQSHFKELLTLLENHKVEYVIVGGYAVAFYGYPRFTKDLDIFYRNSNQNIKKLKEALIKFGFFDSDLPDEIFTEPGNIIQFGIEPLRVDILNEIDGVEIDEVLKNSVRGKYGDLNVNFIGKLELIKNKNSTGRPEDSLDVIKLKNNEDLK